MNRPAIAKLLIANRGEIAVRIMQTAAALDVATVAVFSADDADCAHVRRADEAVALDGTGPRAYLDVNQIVAAAINSSADAVHPGYGFLSENVQLARACEAAGIVFVGPDPSALDLFGDKTTARAHAVRLGVPVLAGTDGPTEPDAAEEFRRTVDGGAVMVKAIAGGGGRGMWPVGPDDDLGTVMARCASEAQSAFGDGRLYVEELLPDARHIEVQIIGDGTGAVSHLWDRDCSVQRRRQKLVEIAPAGGLDDAVRDGLLRAAVALTAAVQYRGLATVEFLVQSARFVFLEVNPRIQVEHTVTEQITGRDLVEAQLRIADGSTLASIGLSQADIAPPTSISVQARVNTEILTADGTVVASGGTLTRFQPPSGPGVRVDTHGYAGYHLNPRFDSLLAKVIVTDSGSSRERVASRAARSLLEFDVAGVDINAGLLHAILRHPGFASGELTTRFVDEHLGDLLADAPHLASAPVANDDEPSEHAVAVEIDAGTEAVRNAMRGVVVDVLLVPGQEIMAGTPVLVVESMKMEHLMPAATTGVLDQIFVEIGDEVEVGQVVASVRPKEIEASAADTDAESDLDAVRADLAEARERHALGLDDARPAAVERIHQRGRRTARENLADLCDPGSFIEYGALAVAAQRQRRSLADLIANTPADGMIAGTARVDGTACVVISYDYSVLAGTQGVQNHRKKDRMFGLAETQGLPVVLFAEGGGGRPGDTDTSAVARLDEPSFAALARLSGRVPLIAVVSGFSFAGNAALAGCCDVIIATEGSSLGMGGPAMIEGGGLGRFRPAEVGPMSIQGPNGVVDVLVADDAAAVAAARSYLSYFTGPRTGWEAADQRRLRQAVPANRVRAYDVRPIIETLADTGSLLELRPDFGLGIITVLARIEGRPVGIMANDSRHLGGAIDTPAADKGARFLQLTDAFGLPVVSLCDTPGFMVGPDAERTATVRHFSRMFLAGAHLRTPVHAVVLRKAYGLGAMAMAGGSFKAPVLAVAWPSGEFGGMGLEGAVRLGYRKELEAVADLEERQRLYERLVAEQYENGKGLSAASVFEIDDVIDPAETRSVLARSLAMTPVPEPAGHRNYVDSW